MGECETVDNSAALQQFVSSGRTGRRNAIPDLYTSNNDSSAAGLAEKLQQLTHSAAPDNNAPGPSSTPYDSDVNRSKGASDQTSGQKKKA